MWARLELGEELLMEYLTIAYERYLLQNYLERCMDFGNPIIYGCAGYSGEIEEAQWAENMPENMKQSTKYFFIFSPQRLNNYSSPHQKI